MIATRSTSLSDPALHITDETIPDLVAIVDNLIETGFSLSSDEYGRAERKIDAIGEALAHYEYSMTAKSSIQPFAAFRRHEIDEK